MELRASPTTRRVAAIANAIATPNMRALVACVHAQGGAGLMRH